MLSMDCDIQMVTPVSEEQQDAGSSTGGVVVQEFCERQEGGPVRLVIVAVHSEVLFKSLVCVLSLTIGLRVIPGGEMQTHIECLTEGMSEMKYKLCTMIRGDMIRNSVF